MTLRWGAVALLVLMATGCATSRVVRLDTGEGRPVIYTPRADAEPVELDEDAFAEAVQKLARTAPLSLSAEGGGAEAVQPGPSPRFLCCARETGTGLRRRAAAGAASRDRGAGRGSGAGERLRTLVPGVEPRPGLEGAGEGGGGGHHLR